MGKFPTKSNWVILRAGSKGSDRAGLEHRIDHLSDIEVEDPAVQKMSRSPHRSACDQDHRTESAFRGATRDRGQRHRPAAADKEEEAGKLSVLSG